MIPLALHLLACVVLAGAALFWLIVRRSAEGAHKFIFPFVIAAVVTAASIILVRSGDLYAMYFGESYQVMSSSGSGQYVDARWSNLAEFLLLILPGFGLFPAVGKRPWLMATLALLAASSMLVSPLMFF